MKNTSFCLLLLSFFTACQNDDNSRESSTDKKNTQAIGCYVPATSDKEWYASGKKAPLFNGLEGIHFTVTTKNKEAQAYFNQGMMLAYGFNHAEAARSFYEATRLDSNCAMAYWGFAYVLGPNYNGGMESDNFERAHAGAAKATALSEQCTPMEKALIKALSVRYAKEPPADRKPLDIAYAAAMKKAYSQFPDHPDIGSLYAESLMDLHPWDLYEKNTKQPREWTPEIVAILEHLMKKNPNHPGAHHFYIHVLESSGTPEKALPSASLLNNLVPGSGHLVHMPSHIYINTGDYHLGSLSNIKAVEVDSNYTTACHAQGVYPLSYYPHNYHFLAATATLEGNSKLAYASANKLKNQLSTDIMRMPGWGTVQHYSTIPYFIAVKFSFWDSILALPAPEKDMIYPQAIWHYARGLAFLGKKDIPQAEQEWNKLLTLANDSSLLQLTIWGINTTADIAHIASDVLAGEIAAAKGDLTDCIKKLQRAIQMEDQLNYDEPPDWFFSVRHHLGAVYIKAGKYPEAEKIYREDLKKLKRNGWALIGLHEAMKGQGKNEEANETLKEFENAWQYADVRITSSSPMK